MSAGPAFLFVACLAAGTAAAAPLETRDVVAVKAAAGDGEASALFDLGRMHRNGIGMPRDRVRAAALIEQAARARHPGAMFTLHNMFANGEGVARDEAKARYWLDQAAAREHPEALQQLSLHLRHGTMGYERDERRAAQLIGVLAHAMSHRDHAH